MKTIRIWLPLVATLTGLLHAPSPLEAQPVVAPGPTGTPAPPAGPLEETDDEHIITDDPSKPWNQGITLEDRHAARELLREGYRLFKIPLFNKAAEKYTAALQKWKHPALYYNLAIAQLNAGQEVEAHNNLEHAIKHGPESLGPDLFQEAQTQLEDLKRHLGRIHITCRTEGAQVALDGVPLFIGPGTYEGWVTAKDHEITAKKPEYLSEARRVTVGAGKRQDINLKLITLSEAAEASRRWATWKPRAVLATGTTIFVISGALHWIASRNFRSYDDRVARLMCANPAVAASSGCRQDHPDLIKHNSLLERARQQQQVAVAGYVLSGSMIAAGVVLSYMNRARIGGRRFESSTTQNTVLVPTMSAEMIGLTLSINH